MQGVEYFTPTTPKESLTSRKLAQNRIINGSNQLWEANIKYGFLHHNQHL